MAKRDKNEEEIRQYQKRKEWKETNKRKRRKVSGQVLTKKEKKSELYCLHQVAASDGMTTLGSNVVNFCFN